MEHGRAPWVVEGASEFVILVIHLGEQLEKPFVRSGGEI